MLTSVFLMEFLMKTVALGFVMHRGSYLQDSWNRLDFRPGPPGTFTRPSRFP
jgi:hypothetical protein